MAKVEMPKNEGEPTEEIVKKVVETTEVIKPVATIRKKSPVERAADDIRNEIVHDVVIPRGKDYLYDIGQGILGIMSDILSTALFGEGARARNVSRDRRGQSRVDYSSISWRERRRGGYKPPWEEQPRNGGGRDRNGRYNLDDVEFPSRRDAESVLDDLVQFTMEYGQVSVDDFFEHPLVKIDSRDAMNRRMGWEELSDAKIQPAGNGRYFIEFPRPHRIDLD